MEFNLYPCVSPTPIRTGTVIWVRSFWNSNNGTESTTKTIETILTTQDRATQKEFEGHCEKLTENTEPTKKKPQQSLQKIQRSKPALSVSDDVSINKLYNFEWTQTQKLNKNCSIHEPKINSFCLFICTLIPQPLNQLHVKVCQATHTPITQPQTLQISP